MFDCSNHSNLQARAAARARFADAHSLISVRVGAARPPRYAYGPFFFRAVGKSRAVSRPRGQKEKTPANIKAITIQ
jgi:hypothetical protein